MVILQPPLFEIIDLAVGVNMLNITKKRDPSVAYVGSGIFSFLTEIKRWLAISIYEVSGRFADTRLGILWLPISNLFIIALLVGLFAHGNNDGILHFAQYVGFGYIMWVFISDSINGGAMVLKSQLGFASSNNMSITQLFLKMTIERGYVLMLSIVTVSPLLLWGDPFQIIPKIMLLISAIILSILVSFYLSYVLSVAVLFVPDLGKFINSMTRFMFFASPVFWVNNGEGIRGILSSYNPIAWFLTLGRQALGISPPNSNILIACVVITIILAAIYWCIHRTFEPRLWNIH